MLAQLDVSDLLAIPTTAGRLDHLRDEELSDAASLGWVLDRSEELVHDNPPAAGDLAELVDQASAAWPAIRARARYQLARLQAERGELAQALRLIAAARGLFSAAGDQLGALRTDLGRMQVLDDLGRHAEAAEVGEALIVALDALPGRADPAVRRVRAHATDNVGAAYGFTGQHTRALEAYEQAERAYRALGLDDLAARPLANRGIELMALGRPREALVDLQAAAARFLTAGDRLFAAQCQGEIALAHQQVGELMPALALLEPARQTLVTQGAHAEADRLQLALAETYLAAGMLPEARAAARRTQERTGRAGMIHDQARARYIVAQTHLAASDGQAADLELTAAAEGFRTVADQHYLARTRLAQADAAALDQRLDDAVRLAELAVRELTAGGWRVPLGWACLRLSDWADDLDTAQTWCDRTEKLAAELRVPELTHQWRLRAARLHRRQGRLAEAEMLLRAAVADLDRASTALADHALRTSFRRDRFAAHDELVGLLLAEGEVEQASAIADEAKARTLRDLLSDAVGSGPDLAAGDHELATAYADLNATYTAIHQATEVAAVAQLRRQADELEQRVSGLRLRSTATAPAPAGRPAGPDPAGSADAVAYYVLGEDVAIFRRQAGGTTALRLPGVVPEVSRHLQALSTQWSRFASGRALSPRHQDLMLQAARQTLGALYDLLVRPVEDLVVAGSTLRIVPHRVLGSVPFQALFDGAQYLVERTAITVVPTLAYAGPQPPSDWWDRAAVVVGAPDASAPEVAREAEQIAARLTGRARSVRLLAGADATSDQVVAALPGAGLVHLACHAVYRADSPLFSRLRLDDRWLTSAEILRLELRGALVALSACESGRHGEAAEPIGLGWAFLAAGAAGVVVSQWMVHDDTAGELMTAYYDGLLAGQPPAESLRQAQLAVAARQPHPYYWAPFTYLASPAPVRSSIGSPS